MASLAPDIIKRIEADFPEPDRHEALKVLEFLDGELTDGNSRVLRCVVFLARGELVRLVHNADVARNDPRDVMLWAEYDENDRQVHDFNVPFASEIG